MNELTSYQLSQLTGQADCSIHTHARQQLNSNSVVQLQNSSPVTPVVHLETLTAEHTYVSTSPSGGSATIYLPSAISSKEYVVTQLTTGTTVITADGTDTITGSATYSLTAQWQSVRLKSNNGVWLRV